MLQSLRTEVGSADLWVFAYASLIWRPETPVVETLPARIHGYHRALQMWSRVNRGTPERPGLVFALVSGGSCRGEVQRIAAQDVEQYLPKLWLREMPNPVYDPKWLNARTPNGVVRALAFTLSRYSPNFTGELSDDQYREIFEGSAGRYGTTWDYAWDTHRQLEALGIHDQSLARLVQLRGHQLSETPVPQPHQADIPLKACKP